ncbi:MAG: TonB-dependent receptor, partial [Bacteroidota bacterium]
MHRFILALLLVLLSCNVLQGQTSLEDIRISILPSSYQIGDLLEEISRQSGYKFSFNSRLIDKEAKINFSSPDYSLAKCLDVLSKRLDLSYRLIRGQIVLTATAQKKKRKVNLSGFLFDKSSGESLIGATVHAIGTAFGTLTNEFGFYSLDLEEGTYKIAFSHVGYKKQERKIELLKSVQSNISIVPITFQLPEVVLAPPLADILNQKQLDAMEFLPDILNNMPEFVGESGLVKGLQSLPGLKTDGDGSAYFHARGGERDQNLIIIDDAPIYNPAHLFGFYSMVVPDFAKSIRVYKGDMPADVGDRLSSIISIRTKDGNLNKFQSSGALNPFVSRFAIETPIRKKKSSIFISSRQSNFDWIYKRDNPQLDVNFRDFQLKWNRKLNDKNRIYFTSLSSSDFSRTFNNDLGTSLGLKSNNFAATF